MHSGGAMVKAICSITEVCATHAATWCITTHCVTHPPHMPEAYSSYSTDPTTHTFDRLLTGGAGRQGHNRQRCDDNGGGYRCSTERHTQTVGVGDDSITAV